MGRRRTKKWVLVVGLAVGVALGLGLFSLGLARLASRGHGAVSPSRLAFTGAQPAAARACDASLASAIRRELIYQPKARMVEGQTTSVVVVLGSTPVSQNTFGSSAPTTVVPLQAPCRVQAQLTGDQFNIQPTGERMRTFFEGPEVRWDWQVTPLKSGRLQLDLEIDPLYVSAGLQFPSNNPTDKSVSISVIAVSASIAHRVWSGLNNALFLTIFGVVLASLLGAVAQAAQRRKKMRRRRG
jgi:hypothetical protein